MPRICRVAPDVTAVERVFDYVVPDALAPLVRVGAIVRVPLHGRRVRGWVVADDVSAETRRASARGARGRVRRPAARRRRPRRLDRLALDRPPHRGAALRVAPQPRRPHPHPKRTGVARRPDRRPHVTPVRRVGGGAAAAVGRPAGAGRVDVRGRRVDARRGGRRVAGAVARAVPARRGSRRRVRALRRVRRGAHRRVATGGAGSCVVVGGRIGRARAGSRSRGRDRGRRRRRGAAGGAVAHVARARRALRARGARGRVVVGRVAGADRRGARARPVPSSTRSRPTSRRGAGRGRSWSTGARSRPARAC